MAIGQLRLSKAELLHRLDRRSRSRYGEPFPESLFNDLGKDALIPELDRSANIGLSPTWYATRRHFRRALQLQRLRSVGIKGRDALRVQLFLRGYGVKVSEVREAIRNEFLRGLSELRPPLRSEYFQSERDPGPAHLASAERQLGELDPRFEALGLKQPTKFIFDKVRLGFGVVCRSPLAALEGLLLAGRNDHPLPELVDQALDASDDAYIAAREFLAWLEPIMFRPLVGRDFIDRSNWPTLALVTILVLRHVQKSVRGFTVANILSRIPVPHGFERLVSNLTKPKDGGEERAKPKPD
jgi:hypothetical protein